MQYKEEKDNKLSIEDRGIYMFTGEVTDEKCDDVIRWLIEENFESKYEMLTLIVNSPGGNVSSGFAVVDTIVGSKIPVRTLGLGIIASMGLLMFIAGKKGERVLTPNTLIMSHQWTGEDFGKEHELLAGIKRNNLISEMVIRHYKKHTGLSEKKIRTYLLPPHDVYLSAKEALDLGLCDEIRLFN